jgi:hypothetical protein
MTKDKLGDSPHILGGAEGVVRERSNRPAPLLSQGEDLVFFVDRPDSLEYRCPLSPLRAQRHTGADTWVCPYIFISLCEIILYSIKKTNLMQLFSRIIVYISESGRNLENRDRR